MAAPAGCRTPGEGRELCERAACKATTAGGWSNFVATSRGRLAGCAGPAARPLARHEQSTGLFVSGLGAVGRASAAQRGGTGAARAQNAVSVETNLYSGYVGTKTPWRDGTTHLVMSPLEFLQRLAALVPRRRLHLIRFHGCWPRTPSCARGWCRQAPRLRPKPGARQPPPATATSTRSRPGRTASPGHGCSSASWLRHNLNTSWSALKLRFRHRHAALPELRRRRAENHRCHPVG